MLEAPKVFICAAFHELGSRLPGTQLLPEKEYATRTSARISSETIDAGTSTSRFKTRRFKTLKSVHGRQKGRASHATTGCNTWMGRIGWAVRRTAPVWHGRGPGAPDTAAFGQDVLPCGRAGLRQSSG